MLSQGTNISKPSSTAAIGAQPNPLRVMLVDDSFVVRSAYAKLFQAESRIDVVATAANGQEAIKLAREHAPLDVIVLDIEMPVMDGLTALPLLKRQQSDVHILMASSLTTRNASATLTAMSRGASDYIAKPQARSIAGEFQSIVIGKILALGQARRQRTPKPSAPGAPMAAPAPAQRFSSPALNARSAPRPSHRPTGQRYQSPQIIAIAASTGGPQAMFKLAPDLSALRLPVVLTQHMPSTFTPIFADHLSRLTKLICTEAQAGMALKPGHLYVAPGGYHLEIDGTPSAPVVRLSDAPPENFCKPAADPMLRSIAKVYGPRVLAVILTGMGSDGAKGAQAVKSSGGRVLAQDEATSVVWGMPGSTVQLGAADSVLPLGAIAPEIMKRAGQ